MSGLDQRLHAFRPDLADERLRESVSASHFVTGEPRRVTRGAIALHREPRHDAPIDTELLRGEAAQVFEIREGWAWLQNNNDGYVGYCAADALGQADPTPTHQVDVLRTYVYPALDLKAPPLDILSLGAAVPIARVVPGAGGLDYAVTAEGEAIVARHLRPLGATDGGGDWVGLALKFVGTPYLWGGRTSIGLDCSALVQLALQWAGRFCPRDSDMQEQSVGEAVPFAERRRGDLVFWKGHVGILLDEKMLLHANGYHMAVTVEALEDVVARLETSHLHVSAVKRLSDTN